MIDDEAFLRAERQWEQDQIRQRTEEPEYPDGFAGHYACPNHGTVDVEEVMGAEGVYTCGDCGEPLRWVSA